jgi:hypothetical protein
VTCGFILAHPARKRRCQAASTREESQSRSDHGSRRANDGYALRPLAGRSSRAPHTEIRRCGCASGYATALNHIHHTCDHQLCDFHHCPQPQRRVPARFKLSSVHAQTYARHQRRIDVELLTMVSMQAYIKAITGSVPNLRVVTCSQY